MQEFKRPAILNGKFDTFLYQALPMVNSLQAAVEGLGIYSVHEAAKYARMPVGTLNRWFFGNSNGEAAIRSTIQDASYKNISFTDFVEALAIRSLRADYGVPLQKIREAIRNAKDLYGVDHPFARKDHKTVLIGKDLHIFLKDDNENPIGLTGKDLRQKSIKACIETYMCDLDYDNEGVARLYKAFQFKNQKVVLDPQRRFGAPIVEGVGYSAETLWQAAIAEGSIAKAADLYEVEPDVVEAAYRYWNQEVATAA